MTTVSEVLPYWAAAVGLQVLIFYVLPVLVVGLLAAALAFIAAQVWAVFGPLLIFVGRCLTLLLVLAARVVIIGAAGFLLFQVGSAFLG